MRIQYFWRVRLLIRGLVDGERNRDHVLSLVDKVVAMRLSGVYGLGWVPWGEEMSWCRHPEVHSDGGWPEMRHYKRVRRRANICPQVMYCSGREWGRVSSSRRCNVVNIADVPQDQEGSSASHCFANRGSWR